MLRSNAQSIIEFLVLLTSLIFILIGIYVVGKILISKQNNAMFSRSIAFKDTYDEKSSKFSEINSFKTESHDTTYKFKKLKARASSSSPIFKNIEKVLNFFSSTQESRINSKLQFDKNYTDILKTLDSNIDLTDSLFMDEKTFAHSDKLKWMLYGIALLRAGFSKTTTLNSLGSDLVNDSSEIMDRENFYYE